MTRFAPLFVLCLLAACGGESGGAPAKATPDEAKALDDAAVMIDAPRPMPSQSAK